MPGLIYSCFDGVVRAAGEVYVLGFSYIISGCTFLLADIVVVDEPVGFGITVRVLAASFVNGAVFVPPPFVRGAMADPAPLVNGVLFVPASFVNGAIPVPASLVWVWAVPPVSGGLDPEDLVTCPVVVFVPFTGVLVAGADPPLTKDPADPSLRVATPPFTAWGLSPPPPRSSRVRLPGLLVPSPEPERLPLGP